MFDNNFNVKDLEKVPVKGDLILAAFFALFILSNKSSATSCDFDNE